MDDLEAKISWEVMWILYIVLKPFLLASAQG